MSGAGFLLAVNLAIAVCFALGFAGLARFDRGRASARWFAFSFAIGTLYFIGEYVQGAGIVPHLAYTLAATSYLCALCALVLGLSRYYAIPMDPRRIFVLVPLVIPLYAVLFVLPRDAFARQLAYQLPFVLMLAYGAYCVLVSKRKGWLDRAMAVLLSLSALNTLVKPVLALLTGGVGATATDYIGSFYAAISQTSGSMLGLAVGMSAFFLVLREIATAMLARTQRDPETGLYTLQGFRARIDVALDGRMGPQALTIIELVGTETQTDHGAQVRLVAAMKRVGPGWAAHGHLGMGQFATLDPAANVLVARRAAKRLLETPLPEGLSLAIGIAETEAGDVASQVMARARAAVSQARQNGGGCVRIAPHSSVAFPVWTALG